MTTSVVAVKVQLLGGVHALIEGQAVTFSNDKRHQLLAYLAYANDWVNRDKLADLFYSDTTEVARQNLRRLLQRVQDLAWLEQLEVERTRLRWKVETDYTEFRKAFEANDLDKALNIYSGSFLKGLESYEDNEFATWLELERQRLHEQWREVVFKKARVSEPQQASKLFQRLLEQDEFDEEAVLALMQVQQANGQSQGALKTYQTFAEHLKREMGLTPSSATQQFAEVLEGQRTPQPLLLSTSKEPKVSLPTPLTSFIGRDLELAEIASLLDEKEVRLLTLLGPGGVGKTRIALQAANELANRYRDGVYFVALDALTNVTAIPRTIAETMKVSLQGQGDVIQQIIQAVKQKQLLLVLDNFEHLVEGATVVSHLIQNCPGLDVLVTSRERLNLDEEHVLLLEGLAVPKEDVSLEDALSYDAVALFIERAKRVRSSFTLTKERLPSVLEICHIVQGFPLGIELAAAWVKLMPCQEIAQEIEKNLDFLESTSRNALERHRSIRATFEYSWKLLTPREQEILQKLSVFRGGFTREAASFVVGANIALLAALIDKSLLRVAEGRYDFHPLLQHYGREKLAASPRDETLVQDRQAQYFYTLVKIMITKRGKEESLWHQGLHDDLDNLRASWEYLLASQKTETALWLSSDLQHFWEAYGYDGEGRDWVTRILADPRATQYPKPRIRALNCAGNLAIDQGDFISAKCHFEAMLEAARAFSDEVEISRALIGLGVTAYYQSEVELAQRYYEEALTLERLLGNIENIGILLSNLGSLATRRGDYDVGKSLLEESLAIDRVTGNTSGETLILNNLGLLAWRMGDYKSARRLLQQCLKVSQEFGIQHSLILALSNLGVVALDQGDDLAALNSSREALTMRWQRKDKWGIAFSLESFASIAATQGMLERALELWGAAEILREEIVAPIPEDWRARYERFVEGVRQGVDETTFSSHWQAGRRMGLEGAVSYALSES